MVRENTNGGNGLTFDLQRRLIMCEGGNRRVSRTEPDGKITVLADRWEGKRLNMPNDVVGLSDGSIYLTDPGDQLSPEEREIKVDMEGRVSCTGPGGTWIFDKDGNRLGILCTPEVPANCAFGGSDNRTLFFTARTSIYTVRVKVPGLKVAGSA